MDTIANGCEATQHGRSRWAYERHHCRCPEAREANKRGRHHQVAAGRRSGWRNSQLAVAEREQRVQVMSLPYMGKPAFSANEIALSLGISSRSVTRIRRRLRERRREAARG